MCDLLERTLDYRAKAPRSAPTMSENPHKTGPTRVLLADDHTMFRQGLARVLANYGAWRS